MGLLIRRNLSSFLLFFIDFRTFFIIDIINFFFAKLIEIELLGKNTYSKVEGLLEDKFNTLALINSFRCKSRIIY